jgi:endogenous inhibitor of DNA gyrase (YacG/DUF329 family)
VNDAERRSCEHCGSFLWAGSRPSRRFCSDRCRNAAYLARQRAEDTAYWLEDFASVLDEMPSPRLLRELVDALRAPGRARSAGV